MVYELFVSEFFYGLRKNGRWQKQDQFAKLQKKLEAANKK